MAQVYVVAGSMSDLEAVKASKMAEILDAVGITYSVSVCSAHRNLPELEEFTKKSIAEGAKVIVALAGDELGLPGAVAGISGAALPVVGVALHPHALDSIVRLPDGVPVLAAGVGSGGLRNAALAAAQILAVGDRAAGLSLKSYLSRQVSEPEFDINLG
jgi:5-(carboxyamino)imidazole ribonucleotide mutase